MKAVTRVRHRATKHIRSHIRRMVVVKGMQAFTFRDRLAALPRREVESLMDVQGANVGKRSQMIPSGESKDIEVGHEMHMLREPIVVSRVWRGTWAKVYVR